MSRELTKIQRAEVDELYGQGGLDSVSQTAKAIHADPQAVGRYLKKRGYTTKFRKRARWIGLGTSILALASAGIIYFSVGRHDD